SLSQKSFSTSVGWSIYGKEQSLDGESSGMNNYSEAFARVSYHFGRKDFSIDAWFKFNGSSPGYILNETNTITTYENPSYSMLDFALSKRTLKFATIQLGIRNLLDVTDVNASVTGSAHNDGSGSIAVGTGRTYFLKLSFDWPSNNKKAIEND
ncbi:MAG: hypothetical protein ACKOYC_02685, partial [Bacteroidota bacterium]